MSKETIQCGACNACYPHGTLHICDPLMKRLVANRTEPKEAEKPIPYNQRDHEHCFNDNQRPTEHAKHLRCCLCLVPAEKFDPRISQESADNYDKGIMDMVADYTEEWHKEALEKSEIDEIKLAEKVKEEFVVKYDEFSGCDRIHKVQPTPKGELPEAWEEELANLWNVEMTNKNVVNEPIEDFIKSLLAQAKKEIKPEQLHEWYLEATKELNPESYNPNAQKSYDQLTEEQRFIDKYIADKINQSR